MTPTSSPLSLHGIIPPMLTPFKTNGDVDYDAHIRNLNRWNNEPLAGYLVLGSNSETPYLTEQEKLKLIELTVGHAKKGRVILAGTGLESTRETIRLTNHAANAGANAALILTPNFYGGHMKDDALIHHFRKIADETHIPILIYNVPAYTHLSISIHAVIELSEHANIIGMKDSSGDVPRLASLADAVPKTFNLIVGSASALYPALTLGVQAGILALANFAGAQCSLVQQFYESGKLDEAKKLYQKLIPVNTAVTSLYGVAGLKCAAGLLGYDAGEVRSPLLRLNSAGEHHIKEILTTANLL